jgi:hypothetical protein
MSKLSKDFDTIVVSLAEFASQDPDTRKIIGAVALVVVGIARLIAVTAGTVILAIVGLKTAILLLGLAWRLRWIVGSIGIVLGSLSVANRK